MRSGLKSVATVEPANATPAFIRQVLEPRHHFRFLSNGARKPLRSPMDSKRAVSPLAGAPSGQFHKRASRGRARPRSQVFAVAAEGSASRFAPAPQQQPDRALPSQAAYPRCKTKSAPIPFGKRQLWPNPSVNRTRYGRRCKPGLLYLRHFRSPGLHRPPPRAGYLKR
jgi:hypothetical protein